MDGGGRGKSAIVKDAGFVSFRRLGSAVVASQAVLHPFPFQIRTAAAPAPSEIRWDSVGRSHISVQLGLVASWALTTVLCVFWTIPVVFVSSLSQLDSLKKLLPFLEQAAEMQPLLNDVLAQVVNCWSGL